MIYQNPQLLYALFAIAIPVLIHLFNLRKHKTVYFSSIRFLKEVKEENKKKSQLRNILILITRILAISFLVIAFAKPYIPANTTTNIENIFLYIDNSQSMDVDFGKGNLLNNAKNTAKEIIDAYPSENNFYLITNDFLSKHTSSYTNESIKLQIEKINSSPKEKSITDIISRKSGVSSKKSHLYFISDFQENTLKIDGLKNSKINNKISLIPIKNNNIQNISIDSLFTAGPIFKSDNKVELTAIIRNTSKKNIENEVLFLYINEKQKAQQYINLLPKESKEVIFEFLTTKSPFISGEIRTQDVPVTFDNHLFFNITKEEKINITTINAVNENIAFKALFKSDTALFSYRSLTTENINHNTLSKQDFIILNEVSELSSGLLKTLLSFTNNGGILLVTPPKNVIYFDSYNILLESLKLNTITSKRRNKLKINKFSTNHPIYKNVFSKTLEKTNYPFSNETYILNNTNLSTQIIGFSNKQNFLSLYSSGKGSIYQFSSPLDSNYNNFTRHALFVPTLINMATSSILVTAPYYIINSDEEINFNHTDKSTNIPHIKRGDIDIIPTLSNKNGKKSLNHNNQITKNGIYSIVINNKIIDKIAFNYKNSEGTTASLDSEQLEDFISKNKIENTTIIQTIKGNLKQKIEEQEIGKEYWKIAILLSLIFFALEILLIKLIKL